MRSVGLKVLKNKLSEYVRLAERGETILIKDRNRVVAELAPPRADTTALSDEEWLADAARRGLVTRAPDRRRSAPSRKPIAAFDEIMKGLAEDREDR
jgi:antitoxin (DNA-binding transcriptional repressor) of toxin-antitoxin stability system